MTEPRTATVERATSAIEIRLALNLDGSGQVAVQTGVGFLDHMLTALARHGRLDLDLQVTGDLDVDDHHTVEDTGLALGSAIDQALGERRGIERFASIDLAMDEACTRVAVDVSGRPYLVWQVKFSRPKVGDFDTELFKEFFHAFAMNAGVCLHLELLYGENSHHIAEASFKSLARALRAAAVVDDRLKGQVASTKGSL